VIVDASAGCQPSWLPAFGSFPGIDGYMVHALAVFDDGGGPELYVGGEFGLAVGVVARNVAKWDGATWSPLGSGVGDWNDRIEAMTVFDDGTGPALYAGGTFTTAGGVAASYVARWDGASWSPLGTGMNSVVNALTVFDDGSGPALYAGGMFTSAGGGSASRIARWSGSVWSPVGSGISGTVEALAVYDDGGGPALHVGGRFKVAGGVGASHVARWDGSIWSPLGTGVDGPYIPMVRALAVFDDGAGPALVAGGRFDTAGGIAADNIAAWDGASWSPLGSGTSANVQALAVFDDGTGPALYAGGSFSSGEGTSRWDGSSWSSVGTDSPWPAALAAFDDGGGPDLYAVGGFTSAGGVTAMRIARWDGASWSPLGTGLPSEVTALAVYDDGTGPALIAGTRIWVGSDAVNTVAKWDGSSWSPLGNDAWFDPASVSSLAVFDDGSGPALYVGFTNHAGGSPWELSTYVAKWDGAGWSYLPSLGSVLPSWSLSVHALEIFDDGGGPALFAGGDFWTAGGIAASYVAKWDGSAWSPLGGGINGAVFALTVFDDGGGPALYAGGDFNDAGGILTRNVARWDGASWSHLGSGTNSTVYSLEVFDDGSGPALYAGGHFTSAGSGLASNVARWDGSSWSSLGTGLDHVAMALTTFDDGSGPALYAGGYFASAGGVAASCMARWDGNSWSPLGSGTVAGVQALAVLDDGTGGGPALFAAGDFGTAHDSGDSFVAKWGCPGSIAEVPGCFGNPATLSAAGVAQVGQALAVEMQAGAIADGLAFLYVGLDGTDALGCGLALPGFDEILISPAPAPILFAQQPTASGSAAFQVAIPADPNLVGTTVLFQAVNAAVAPIGAIELSKGLSVLFVQ
jgi:hypothetical protein